MSDEGPLSLLLVDDDEALRRVTARQLEKAGYEVTTARDGQAGLEEACANPPDLIVSDIMMPRLDGLGLCRALREEAATADCYIMLLTARDRTEDVVEGLSAEADDYLTKPFSVPELQARVNAGARLVRLQKELRHKNGLLQQAVEAQARIWGMAAHDVRAPLSIITTYLGLLGQEMIDAEEIKRVCLRRAEGLMQLVDDLLDITKIESGKITLDCVCHDLVGILRGVLEGFQPLLKEKELSLDLDLADEPLSCCCDARRITHVLENLLSNAVKYTDAGGRITVACGPREEGAWVEVSDTGCGILPENLSRIFEPFANVESPGQSSVPHTGLGLAICRKLLEMHGGELSAESEGEGRGATFRFILPADGPPEALPA